MNKSIGIQLIAYSLLLSGLSCLAHHLATSVVRPTLVTGLVGGAFCFLWGLRALLGKGGKAVSILTLIPISYVALSQALMTWVGAGQGVPGQRKAALVIAMLFVLSIAMLMRIAYAGAAEDMGRVRPAKDQGTKPQTTGNPAAQPRRGGPL